MLSTPERKCMICERGNSEFLAYHTVLKLALISLALLLLADLTTFAQSSVTTQHYDISRTGANSNETILTPTNVNTNTFGKLFSNLVDGYVYAQPLYMPGVTMGAGTAQAGTVHNVVYVATENDSVFAFDGDSNIGANANPLWQVSLLGAGETAVSSADVSSSDIAPQIGITSTPVIDPTTNTIYVVAASTVGNTTYIQRLHALDITTGNEKFGGPVALSASVPGTGNGSSGGTLNWDPLWENNRTGLLLLNGIVYIGFASHGDNGPWHGWILAYSASTLTQTGAWCSTPNAAGAGIWLSGTGLAADVPSGKPYGRIFTATGNGTFDAVAPDYTNAMDYGDSIIKLDLNNGVPTMNASGTVVGDDFTPHDQAAMDNADEDVASGGVVLIPPDSAVQVGKSGRVYILNREDLGGYNANNTTDPEQAASVGGLWGAPAYWNGNVYIWSTSNNLEAFSYANGVLSANPTSTSNESATWPSPTPSVSANGTTNGIVWSVLTDNYSSQGTAVLYAHNASNVNNLLYSSATNATRDNPGNSVKFVVPTVVNGKVYVGSESQLSVFGLLNGATQAATPVISPASESFSPSIQVTIADSTSGASIYYTTNGSQPTAASTQYTAPFTLTTTTTLNAIAAGTGLLQSPEASATYILSTQAAMPIFNPAPDSYATAQSVTISTTTPNATIYYTTNGTTATTSSTQYMGPISVGVTETLSAIAVVSGLSNSPVASGLYTFDLGVSSISFASGFAGGGMNLVGSAKLNGSSLELTDGGTGEAAAAWYQVEASISSFATDFTFQITPGTNPIADGFTFAIQGNNPTAVGPEGGGLGYGGTDGIPHSVAVKFDLYNNDGEGTDSTGLYTNGASPMVPAVDMTSSGVNLHSGDPFHVHITYDGTTLVMTITDTTTNATFTTSWAVDIPATVGDVVAYVGFTGGTGGDTAIQNIQTWTFTASAATPTISPAAGTYATAQTVTISDATSGATIYYTTNGTTPTTSSTQYTGAITVSATETIEAIAVASGYATSTVKTAAYTITSGNPPVINLGSGFTAGAMTLNGSATLNGTRLQLTNGGTAEAASAWYSSAVNIQEFTTNFSFQITGGTKPTAD
ncbi:MAG: chitobiase/beta-hexosaminidase C-terminal domain-containing protein, partial [Acidobacteriaceae bacterium]